MPKYHSVVSTEYTFRWYVVIFVAACGRNCIGCDLNGAYKCDHDNCYEGFVYNSNNQICEGERSHFRAVIIISVQSGGDHFHDMISS